MRVDCLHGFFQFRETAAGQISRFMSLFGFSLVRSGEFYTFEFLEDAPGYSIEGSTYLGAVATVTYAGEPWEIMRANNLVYDFNLNQLVVKTTVTQRVEVSQGLRYFLSNGLLLPGSLMERGERVMDYAAWYSFEAFKFKYSEVTYG